MKLKSILFYPTVAFLGLSIVSCTSNKGKQANHEADNKPKTEVILKDYGAHPLVLNIEDYTLENTNFRTALWTGSNMQITLMSIPVGGEVGLEIHHDIEQFLRIEGGTGKVMIGDSRGNLDFVKEVGDDFAIFVPAGKWHNIVNTGDRPLKLYSIYSPVEHPFSTVHKTYEEAMEAEHHH